MRKTFLKKYWHKKALLTLFTLIFCITTYFLLPETLSDNSRRVISIIIFAILFWGFELVPLYATSILVAFFLSIFLQKKMGFHTFLIPFSSPVIFLFLGGLVLALAAHKHHLDRFLMEKMLLKVGHSTQTIVIGILCITAFFSMWISNTAAAALMLLLIKPLINKLAKTDPLRKAMALAVAFGANLGGIATPIGTPPNAIAIGILRENGFDFNFLTWMLMTLPLAIILLGLAAIVLHYFYPPIAKRLPKLPSNSKTLTRKGIFTLSIGLLIIFLWLTKPLHHIPEEIVALGGVGLFTATNLISVKDFRNIPWDVLILIWGGLALGEAVIKSGLITEIMHVPLFGEHGYILIAAFCVLAIILTSFISNTATANLLLPLAIGVAPFAASYISITVALCCSFALMMPISTPPNALAYASGTFQLKDMVKSGSVIALLSLIIVLLGFELVIPFILKLL